MAFDPAKLSPAPWFVDGPATNDGLYDIRTAYADGFCQFLANNVWIDFAAFVVLARSAFDVMMRRGWNPCQDIHSTWFVLDCRCRCVHPADDYRSDDGRFNPVRYGDPFTAIVEADRWYRENVEAKEPNKET